MFNRFNLAETVLAGMAPAVDIKAERCSRIAHRKAKCNICESNCPRKAIHVGEVSTNISINQEQCSHCGICTSLCPTGVYSFKHLDYRSFLNHFIKAISEDGALRIACNKSDIEATKTECLGAIGLAEILHFYTNGAKEIQLDFADCKSCTNRYGRDIIEDELEELRKLDGAFQHLRGLNISANAGQVKITFPMRFERPAIADEIEEQASASGLSRREAFNEWRKKATDTALHGASLFKSQEPAKRTQVSGVKSVPTKRRSFTTALTKLGQLIQTDVAIGAYFYAPNIAPDCKFCLVCTRLCPTGALHVSEDGRRLLFNASKCTSCGICRVSCYHGYIKSAKTADLQSFFDDVDKSIRPY